MATGPESALSGIVSASETTTTGRTEAQVKIDAFKKGTSPNVQKAVTELAEIGKKYNYHNIAQAGLKAVGDDPSARTNKPLNEFDSAFSGEITVSKNSAVVADREAILEIGHQQLAEEHFANAENFKSFDEYANDTHFPKDDTSNKPDQATVDFINTRKGPLIEKRLNVLRNDLAKGTLTYEQAQKNINAIPNDEIKAALQKALNESPQGKAALRDKLLSSATEPDGTVDFAKLKENITKDPSTMGLPKLEQIKLANEFANIADQKENIQKQAEAEKKLITATENKKNNEKEIARHEQIQITRERQIKNLRAALRGVLPGAAAGLAVVALFGGGGSVGWMVAGGLTGASVGGLAGAGISEYLDPKTEDFRIRELKSKGNAEINFAKYELSAAQQRARLAEMLSNANNGDVKALETILNLAVR